MPVPVRLAPLAFVPLALPALTACAPAATGGAATPTGGTAAQQAGAAKPVNGDPAASAVASAPGGPGNNAAAGQTRRVPLRFDIQGTSFPSPLIDAIVGGQPTTLLIDTGATHHVITGWLADELALPQTTAGDVGLDHAGRPVRITRVEGAAVSLSGWGRVDVPTLLVVPVPEVLQRMGIGGFLSPQALAAGRRAVILDLRAGEMRDAPFDDAVRAAEASPEPGSITELALCGGENEGRQLIAPVLVNGVAVQLKVDSGATQSSLFAASEAGKRFAAGARGAHSAYAASGKHTVPVLEKTRVQIGGGEVVTDVDLLPNAPRPGCPADGFIGMDALRQCTLILGETRAVARCRRPG